MKCLICCEWLNHRAFIPSFVLSNFPMPARVGAVKRSKLIMKEGMANKLFCPCSSLMSITHRGVTQEDMNINKATLHEASVNIFDVVWHHHLNIEANVQTRRQHSLCSRFWLALFSLKSRSPATLNPPAPSPPPKKLWNNVFSALFTTVSLKVMPCCTFCLSGTCMQYKKWTPGFKYPYPFFCFCFVVFFTFGYLRYCRPKNIFPVDMNKYINTRKKA